MGSRDAEWNRRSVLGDSHATQELGTVIANGGCIVMGHSNWTHSVGGCRDRDTGVRDRNGTQGRRPSEGRQ